MAMLPTLPSAQRMAELLGNRQEVLQVESHFEPLLATLPEALWRISVFLYEMKRNDVITYRSAVLPNHVPGPVFLRRISASWRLAHHAVVMACFAEAVSNWTVIQFSMRRYSDDITGNKKGLRCDSAYHRRCPMWAFKS